MRLILSNVKQAFSQTIFVLGLMLFISLTSLCFDQQPSYAVSGAANRLTPDEKIDRAYDLNEAAGIIEEQRSAAYEEAIKVGDSPQSMEKAYEKNEKAYEKEHPQPNIIEKAKELIEGAN